MVLSVPSPMHSPGLTGRRDPKSLLRGRNAKVRPVHQGSLSRWCPRRFQWRWRYRKVTAEEAVRTLVDLYLRRLSPRNGIERSKHPELLSINTIRPTRRIVSIFGASPAPAHRIWPPWWTDTSRQSYLRNMEGQALPLSLRDDPATATHELPTVAELAAAHDLRDSSVYRLSEACELVLDELAQREIDSFIIDQSQAES